MSEHVYKKVAVLNTEIDLFISGRISIFYTLQKNRRTYEYKPTPNMTQASLNPIDTLFIDGA